MHVIHVRSTEVTLGLLTDEVLPFTVTEEEKASGDLLELSPGEHPPEGVVHTEGGRDGRQLEIWVHLRWNPYLLCTFQFYEPVSRL